MKIGTRSVLFGYHQFLLHGCFVAAAWVRLFGWTWQWQRWASFFVHDIGYLGKPDMDGVEGETHPLLGGQLMFWLTGDMNWFFDALFHSRTFADNHKRAVSQLCYADKLAFLMYPRWLLKALYAMSGEFEEYRQRRYSAGVKNRCEPMSFNEWHAQAVKSNEATLFERGGFLTMKFMIVGHGRHGKDTVAEMISERLKLPFTSSSLKCAALLFPELSKKYAYDSVQTCFDDRHNHRAEWFDLICKINSPDKSSLGRLVYQTSDIYVGIRDWRELQACKNANLYDVCVWVDRSLKTKLEAKSSMTVEAWMADYMLDNNGTLEDLDRNLNVLLSTIRRKAL